MAIAECAGTAPLREQWLVPPRWMLVREAGTQRILDLNDGTTLELRGQIAESLPLDGGACLRPLAQFQPRLRELADDLARFGARPLDRAALLRGTGFRQLFVELTGRCNERCTHCYADASPERRDELPEPVVMQILADGLRLGFGHVQLTGGDPLIARTFLPAARRAVELGFDTVEVYTNGLALDAALLAELKGLPLRFAMSFYSHDPARHDAVTATPGSQVRTAAAIQRALGEGYPVRIGLVATDATRQDAQATVDYLLALGVPDDAIRVDVSREVGRGSFLDKPINATRAVGGTHASAPQFGGRAAVAYDGRIHPCIFSRQIVLGSVHDEGGLYGVLTRPDPVTVGLDAVLDDAASCHAQLSCRDCRLRASILGKPRLAVLRS